MSRNFDIEAVTNGTADLGSPKAYSVKFVQQKIEYTQIANTLSITCTHQDNILVSMRDTATLNTTNLASKPNWPQINADIKVAPASTIEPKTPLTVSFSVSTSKTVVTYTKTLSD